MLEELIFLIGLVIIGMLILLCGGILAVLVWVFIWMHVKAFELMKGVYHGIVPGNA